MSEVTRKIIMVGDSGVGKTSLMFTYVEGTFRTHFSTIGAGERTKVVDVDGVPVMLDIWDTAGQERYRSQIRMYLTKAAAALAVFDVNDPATFDHIPEWVQTVRDGVEPDTKIFLVGNKTDLEPVPGASQQAGDRMAAQLHAEGYFQTSAARGDGIEGLFLSVAAAALSVNRGDRTELALSSAKSKKKCC
jgi:small GTP-binding protein